MGKSFSINFTGDQAAKLERARQLAKDNGVQLLGDASKGTFSGRGVEGDYTVSGDVININIEKKPLVIPWTLIESQLKQFFQ